MTEQKKTSLWMAAAGGMLLARELYVLAAKKRHATESECVWDAASNPTITFAAGFLCGHLFWQQKDVYEDDK